MLKKLEYKDFINGKLLDDLKDLDLNSPDTYTEYNNIVDRSYEIDARMTLVLSKGISDIKLFYEKDNELSQRFYTGTTFEDGLLNIRLETESEFIKLPADAKVFASTSRIKLKMALLTAKSEYDRTPQEFEHLDNLMKNYDNTNSMNLF